MLVSADEYWAGSPAKIVKLRWGLFSAALLGFFVLIFAFLIGLLLGTFRSSLVPPLELKQIESEADKRPMTNPISLPYRRHAQLPILYKV